VFDRSVTELDPLEAAVGGPGRGLCQLLGGEVDPDYPALGADVDGGEEHVHARLTAAFDGLISGLSLSGGVYDQVTVVDRDESAPGSKPPSDAVGRRRSRDGEGSPQPDSCGAPTRVPKKRSMLTSSSTPAPHDLLRMSRQGRIYSAAASRYYSEPKRLAALGLLEARTEPGRTHHRTWYTLTGAGRRAVADWLAQPSAFIRIQNEPAARLNRADLADDERTVVRSLQAIRPEIEDQLTWLARAEQVAATLPHRERYLRLNHGLSRRILHAFLDWLDEVERELGGDSTTVEPALRDAAD
jgi:PadR family transcriptional regulator, regulatory protein AphA